jgi:hypothetical protein
MKTSAPVAAAIAAALSWQGDAATAPPTCCTGVDTDHAGEGGYRLAHSPRAAEAHDPATILTTSSRAEQRRVFRALFTDLAEGDEHRIRSKVYLPIANALAFALADGAIGEGELFLTVRVDEKGEPQSTNVYATPSQRISKEAATVLMKIRYKPATCAGKPCTSEFPFTARFE